MAETNGSGEGAKVVIIGAGPAGLLTAHALQMQGADVTVIEQDKGIDARSRDWNFGIYWAGSPLAECLPEHIAREVENTQVDDHRAGKDEVMKIFNSQTEEVIVQLPVPDNLRLARKKLLRLLAQDVNIQYGKRPRSISSDGKSATVIFEDGTRTAADLLIGADGARSQVRDYLLDIEESQLEELPLRANSTLAVLPAEAASKFLELTNRLLVAFNPNGSFTWFSVHDKYGDSKPGDWSFMMIMSWPETEDDAKAGDLSSEEALFDIKKRAEAFGERFKLIWQSIPEGTRCWNNRLSHWVPRPWNNHNGTITLVGDASHAMTFHRGQGLNNAVHDVALLARKTKEFGFDAKAINAYEEEMLPRAREAVLSSTENSLATHNWETLKQSPLFKTALKQH